MIGTASEPYVRLTKLVRRINRRTRLQVNCFDHVVYWRSGGARATVVRFCFKKPASIQPDFDLFVLHAFGVSFSSHSAVSI